MASRSILVVLILALAGVAHAQQPPQTCTYTDDNGKVHTIPNCAPANAPTEQKPAGPPVSPAKRFPYPGETPAPDATTPPPQANAAPTTAAPDPSLPASKRLPYPGEPPSSTAPDSKPSPASQGLQDAGSSGFSSSSSSPDQGTSSSAIPGLPSGPDDDTPADDAAAAERRQARKKLPAVPRQSPSEREQEDVNVAEFYQNDGNFRGAYMRAQDAVSLDDTDPAAHLALAEAARKLGKLDEAQKQYKRCLELDPLPKDRKTAERALKEMSGGA